MISTTGLQPAYVTTTATNSTYTITLSGRLIDEIRYAPITRLRRNLEALLEILEGA